MTNALHHPPTAAPGTPRHALLRDVSTGASLALTPRRDLDLWPEIQALKHTPQDPEWHAEGDVLIHTDMVLAETPPIAAELPTDDDRVALRLACLLHDIAKPDTTRFDDEVRHIIARGHEREGGVRSRYLLHGAGFPHALRRQVAQLVATHHLVKRTVKGIDGPDGALALTRLATRVDTRLLWALELADMRGRVAVDRAGQIEIVEMFRMLCDEQSVFGRAPAPWLAEGDLAGIPLSDPRTAAWLLAETHRRRLLGTITNPHHALAFCHEHAGHRPAEVIITVGVSGSGKSYAVNALDGAYERISPDAERRRVHGDEAIQGEAGPIHQACLQQLRAVLRRGGRAVYDATNIAGDVRAKVTSLCHDYAAHVTLWVFDVPREAAHRRNRERDRRVPAAVIDRQIERFQWPLAEEAHAVRVFDVEP